MADEEVWSETPETWQEAPASMTGKDIAADVAKSGGTGIIRGGIGLAGLPGDLAEYGARGIDYGVRGARSLLGLPAERPREWQEPTYGSADITKGVEHLMGAPLYEPQTTAGRYAESVGEFIPAALAGPGGMARRLVGQALIPGAASETAGEAARALAPAAEPYARFAGGFLGGAKGAFGGERASVEAARKQLLKQEGPAGVKGLYGEWDKEAQAAPVDWKQTFQLTAQMRGALNRIPFDTEAAEKLIPKLNSANNVADLVTWRRGMRDTLYGKGMGQAAQTLTNYVDRAIEAAMPAGHPGVSLLQKADHEFSVLRLAEALDKKIGDIEAATAATHSGANFDNKIRQGLLAFSKNERAMHGLTDQERVQLLAIINGTSYSNTLRYLSNVLGGGGGLGMLMAGYVGHQIIPGVGAFAPVVGKVLKHLENRAVDIQAHNLLGSVAGRSGFAQGANLRMMPLSGRALRAGMYGTLAAEQTPEGYPYYQAEAQR